MCPLERKPRQPHGVLSTACQDSEPGGLLHLSLTRENIPRPEKTSPSPEDITPTRKTCPPTRPWKTSPYPPPPPPDLTTLGSHPDVVFI